MLCVKNLCKSYGSLLAVDDLCLEIERGTVFGLLGPNGAGKTTTVNMAVGLLDPDAGVVELTGYGSPRGAVARAKIGVAPQSLAIYDELSADENIRFFAGLYGLARSTINERVDWALKFVELTDRRNDRVKTYSGGMKRRLNLAIALVHDPPLLLLDEPTVGVDPQSRNAIFDNIEALRREGRTVVYTTHYMEEAQRLCDRVGIMDHGKLLANDTVSALIERYGGKSVVTAKTKSGDVRVETDDPVAELSRLRDGGGLVQFQVDQPDLEAVFLNLTGRQLRD